MANDNEAHIAVVNALRCIASDYNLHFYDETRVTDVSAAPLPKSAVKRLVIHSYGVRRKQPFSAITSWFQAAGTGAHIYISLQPGGSGYIGLLFRLDRRAQHVGVHNTSTIGIELNEGPCNQITTEDELVLSKVIDAVLKVYGDLEIVTHRQLTGKNCPAGYDYDAKTRKFIPL